MVDQQFDRALAAQRKLGYYSAMTTTQYFHWLTAKKLVERAERVAEETCDYLKQRTGTPAMLNDYDTRQVQFLLGNVYAYSGEHKKLMERSKQLEKNSEAKDAMFMEQLQAARRQAPRAVPMLGEPYLRMPYTEQLPGYRAQVIRMTAQENMFRHKLQDAFKQCETALGYCKSGLASKTVSENQRRICAEEQDTLNNMKDAIQRRLLKREMKNSYRTGAGVVENGTL